MFDSTLFRQSAIHHHYSQYLEGTPVPLRIAPLWSWLLCWVLLGLLVAAGVLSFAMRVDVNSTGSGVLRNASGSGPMLVQIGGTVARICVQNGQRVQAGELLLELDAAATQSQLLEAERALQQLHQVTRPTQSAMDALSAMQEQEIQHRLASLKEQIASQEQSVQLSEHKLKSNQELEKQGIVGEMNVEDAREALAQVLRSLASARQSLMSAQQDYQAFQAHQQQDRLQRTQDAQAIQTKRDALAFALSQLQFRAQEAGIVDGLHLRVGEVVTPGQEVIRLVPEGAALRACTLLAEKDRAFVKVGDSVRLEVVQYPIAEYGTLHARVLHVGEMPITSAEAKAVLGEGVKVEEANYLVELDVLKDAGKPIARQPLRTGMAVQARYSLRRQRPATFLLEPLRRWME